ncbi:MAG: universal stress protein [Candidatus Omnitrophota bacterium]|jgi:nucleotide-binding universal stress UspA family protein
MIKRILVEIDETPSTDSVIKHAIALAQAHDAALTGVTVVDIDKLENVGPVPFGATYYAEELRDDRIAKTRKEINKRSSRFAELCGNAGVPFHVEHETGSPFAVVVSKARYHDLIVVGLGSLFSYKVVDEPSHILEHLIREGVQPILGIPKNYVPIKRVLIAYSGSLHSAEAMKQFLQFRLWPDAVLRLVCFDQKPEETSRALDEGVTYCRAHGFSADRVHLSGNDKNILIKHAEEWHADLIVMGNSMRNVLIKHSEKALFLAQ